MLSTNKAKEMKLRASQRRATHKARRAALTLRVENADGSQPKLKEVRPRSGPKVTSNQPQKKASPRKNNPRHARILHVATHRHAQWRLSQRSSNKPWRPALSLLVVLISLRVVLIWFAV
jgi:hypothetical protein